MPERPMADLAEMEAEFKRAEMDLDRRKRMLLQPYQRRAKNYIPSGRDHWHMVRGQRVSTWPEFVQLALNQQFKRDKFPRAISDPRGEPVIAMVIENRWIARCECGGSEVVDPNEPRFYCFSCHNTENRGFPRPIVWPERAERVEIEKTLTARPDPLTRGWIPSETIQDLEAENAAHNLPLKNENYGRDS